MKKKIYLLIGIFLLIIAVCFMCYVFNHPEAISPWGNRVTFILYGIYIWLLFKFLLDIPVLKTNKKIPSDGSLIRALFFFFVAIVFLIMEIAWDKVNFFTIIRGFVVIGGIDRGIENLLIWIKNKTTKS